MDSILLNSPKFTMKNKNCLWVLPDIHKSPYSPSSFSFLPFLSQRLRSRSNSTIMAAAKKQNNKNPNKKRKDDNHSFVSRPDEATGPFPEAVLMKEKKVEEDGRLMPEFADVEERELFEALNLQLESDMDVDQMRHYEVVYLIHENHKEEVQKVNTKIQEFLKEKKGKIWRFSDWGMRRLAYKIQKARNAHYILMNFELEAQWINDFKNLLDKDERVIRHLVIKKDEAETQDCPPPPEFHSFRGEMDSVDEDEDEDLDEEEYDDDDEDEDEDEENDGIILVDDDDDVNDRELSSSISGRSKVKA